MPPRRRPPGTIRPPARLGAAAVWLTLVAAGCTTTWAEIHGPNLALGLDLDDELNASPRVEAGYHWFLYKDAMGVGAGAVAAHAPLSGWTQIMAEFNLFMFPLLGFPQAPFALRIGGAFHEDEGSFLAVSFGIDGLLYKPPEACNPPLEGPWDGCPPGVWLPEDSVYPEYVPRAGFLYTNVFRELEASDGEDCCLGIYTLKFDLLFAWWLLNGGPP